MNQEQQNAIRDWYNAEYARRLAVIAYHSKVGSKGTETPADHSLREHRDSLECGQIEHNARLKMFDALKEGTQ